MKKPKSKLPWHLVTGDKYYNDYVVTKPSDSKERITDVLVEKQDAEYVLEACNNFVLEACNNFVLEACNNFQHAVDLLKEYQTLDARTMTSLDIARIHLKVREFLESLE